MARMSTEKFVEKFRARHPDSTIKLDKFEYLGDKVASTVYCGVEGCGYEWEIRPSNLMQGRGCKECKYRNQNESRKITEKQFITETKKRDPEIDLSKFEYKGLKEHGWAVCKTCKHEWWVQAESVMRKTGCPQCGYKKMTEKRFYQDDKYEYLKARLKEDNIVHSSLDGKKGADTVHCKCGNCDREWDPLVSNLVQHKTGCPSCASEKSGSYRLLSLEEFKRRLDELESDWSMDLTSYRDYNSEMGCVCSLCGNQKTLTGRQLLSGHRCSVCLEEQKKENLEETLGARLEFSNVLTGNRYIAENVPSSFTEDFTVTCSEHGKSTINLKQLRLSKVPDCCSVVSVYLLVYGLGDSKVVKVGFSETPLKRLVALMKSRRTDLKAEALYMWEGAEDDEGRVLSHVSGENLTEACYGPGYSETRKLTIVGQLENTIDKVSTLLGKEPYLIFRI